MKTVVWAALQSMETLEQVDRMLPGLVDESELDRMPRFYRYRRGIKKFGQKSARALQRAENIGAGISLVWLGCMMLIPGPGDFIAAGVGGAVAGYFFGAGAVATGMILAVAFVNLIAVAIIVVGVYLIAKGLFGF